MRSAKFEFVLKKNKAENRILNDFTLSSNKLRLTLVSSHNLNNFHMGKTMVLHSCLKTIALRGRRYPTVTIALIGVEPAVKYSFVCLAHKRG